jgi:hypothetical protein
VSRPSAARQGYGAGTDTASEAPIGASRSNRSNADRSRPAGPWEPEPVAEAIEAGLAKFTAHGVDVETCLIGQDGSDDVETVVGIALRAHRWECVTIGGGLRHSDDQVELLEQVTNLVRRHAPDAAIAFNSTPANTYEGAVRWTG